MKNSIFTIAILSFIVACSPSQSGDKKAELENLKKQAAELKSKIEILEKEIASNNKGKTLVVKEVSIAPVTNESFSHFIEVQAKVEGDDNVTVSAETMGTISSVIAKPGDAVTKGKILATIDDKVYLKALEELENARALANTIFQKQKNLWDQKIGSEIQFLQAKNTLESLDKKIATVQEQLNMTKIKSPINGTVDKMDIKVGQMISPGMPGIRVVNFSNLKITAEVAESYISKVKRNDPVQIFFPDLNKTIDARINYSAKVIDPLNRTFNVEVLVSPKDITIYPNMIAVLKIADYTNKNAVVLPANMIQNSPEGTFVYVANGKTATKKAITVGNNYKGKIEVVSGLSTTDQIITVGFQDLVEGQPINY